MNQMDQVGGLDVSVPLRVCVATVVEGRHGIKESSRTPPFLCFSTHNII